MKAKVLVLLVLLSVSPGMLGCTATATHAAPATASRTVEMRRLGLSEKEAPATPLGKVVPGPATTAEPTVAMEPFTDEAMGIQGVAPRGWREAGLGVRARAVATIIKRSVLDWRPMRPRALHRVSANGPSNSA